MDSKNEPLLNSVLKTKRRGRPSKKKISFKLPTPPPTPEPTPQPPTPEPTPPPPQQLYRQKRIMTQENLNKRLSYLKKKLSLIGCPSEREKYRNLILKYERDDIEII